MRRLSNEDGFNAGARNAGRFALSLVPYGLGMGALVWLGFFVASHDILHTLSQEQRRAIYVGAFHRPKGKMVIRTPQVGCLKITHVDLDGSTAAVYFQNNCHDPVGRILVQWQLFSPNGTRLESGSSPSEYIGGPAELNPGEQGEVVFTNGFLGVSGTTGISTDSRASEIEFTVQ